MRHPDLDALFQRRRAVTTVARALGISKTAVSKWPVVPPNRVVAVARALGVDPSEIPTRPVDQRVCDMATALGQDHWHALTEPQRDAVAACHAASFNRRQAATVRRTYQNRCAGT